MERSDKSSSKKRKRREEKEEQRNVKIVIDKSIPAGLGPVLATFPSVDPPKDLKFTQYYLPDRNNPNASVHDRPNFIFGETDKVQFTSSNLDQGHSDKGYFSQYVVGVYNKRTKTLTLPPTPTPLHIVTHEVTALKNLESIHSKSLDHQRLQAKNALGEAFGTKKVKSAIRAMERNKVDVSSMQGVAGHLQNSIEAATSSLPTKEEANAIADTNRPIPPLNTEATTPSEAYPLDSVIPQIEFDTLSVSDIIHAPSNDERLQYFPANRSEWIKAKLNSLFRVSSKPSKTNLKILLYISILWSFKLMAFKVHDKATLQERLSGVSGQIIDGIISRFTEQARGSSEFHLTPHAETKLLSYIFALCLRLDGFSTTISTLASDLHMPEAKAAQHFKSLGCTIELPTAAEREVLKISNAEAKERKKAVLKIPLTFPKPKSGKRRT